MKLAARLKISQDTSIAIRPICMAQQVVLLRSTPIAMTWPKRLRDSIPNPLCAATCKYLLITATRTPLKTICIPSLCSVAFTKRNNLLGEINVAVDMSKLERLETVPRPISVQIQSAKTPFARTSLPSMAPAERTPFTRAVLGAAFTTALDGVNRFTIE
jgi:hypothetical protein